MNDIHTTRQVCYSMGARWFLRLNVVHATRRVFRPAEKTAEKKKLHDRKFFDLHLCKLETYTYISLATIYGLTAITKILVAWWKHTSFLCYSMGARWFLRILGPKLELPSKNLIITCEKTSMVGLNQYTSMTTCTNSCHIACLKKSWVLSKQVYMNR